MISKTCSACKQAKPTTQFGKRTASKDGLAIVCKPCNNAISKAWRKANPGGNTESVRQWKLRNPDKVKNYIKKRRSEQPEKVSAVWRKHKYGITAQQYDAMLLSQSGRCAICAKEFHHVGRKTHKPQVDHDHATGKVRGLLCTECNHGLGRFMDSPERLLKAVEYLRRAS